MGTTFLSLPLACGFIAAPSKNLPGIAFVGTTFPLRHARLFLLPYKKKNSPALQLPAAYITAVNRCILQFNTYIFACKNMGKTRKIQNSKSTKKFKKKSHLFQGTQTTPAVKKPAKTSSICGQKPRFLWVDATQPNRGLPAGPGERKPVVAHPLFPFFY